MALFLPTLLIAAPATEVRGGRITGLIDLRPSWQTGRGAFHSENELSAKAALSPSLSLGLLQKFRTAWSTVDAELYDGYARSEWLDLWASPGAIFSLSHEGRLYLPTSAKRRERGFVTAVGSQLRLAYRPDPALAFFLSDTIVVPWYRADGAVPLVENEIKLTARALFMDGALTAKLALVVRSTRASGWAHAAWIYPELLVAVAPSTTIGLAYYTATLVASDLSSTSFAGGFRQGVAQLVFTQAL